MTNPARAANIEGRTQRGLGWRGLGWRGVSGRGIRDRGVRDHGVRNHGVRNHGVRNRFRRDERGEISSPIVFPLAISLLVFPVLIMVLSFPTWSERQIDATTAARNAARVLATAPDWNTGVAEANQVVTEIAVNNGLSPSDVSASFTGSLDRGATVTASVTVLIPATVFPGFHVTTAEIHWTATSTEQVDQYRSIG